MIFSRGLIRLERSAASLLCGLIRAYRRFLSPLLPPSCRFIPTCSEYALEALDKKRLPQALKLIIVRLLKCNPFHRGGYDPVPGNDECRMMNDEGKE